MVAAIVWLVVVVSMGWWLWVAVLLALQLRAARRRSHRWRTSWYLTTRTQRAQPVPSSVRRRPEPTLDARAYVSAPLWSQA